MDNILADLMGVKYARLIIYELFPNDFVSDVYVSKHYQGRIYKLIARVIIRHTHQEIETVCCWNSNKKFYEIKEAILLGNMNDIEPWKHGSINLWEMKNDSD